MYGYAKGEFELERKKKENRERVASAATHSATAPQRSPSAKPPLRFSNSRAANLTCEYPWRTN